MSRTINTGSRIDSPRLAGDSAEPVEEPRLTSEDGLLRFPADAGDTDSAPQERHVARWNLLEERRLDPTRPSHRGYRRRSDFWVSTTDPDASPMWTAGKARLGYHDHYVVDERCWICCGGSASGASFIRGR